MQKLEMFFHAGDYDKQVNFIIFPESLNITHEEEIIYEVEKRLVEYKGECIRVNNNIIKTLNQNNSYPDPTKYKKNSSWYYSQLSNGTIVYRFNMDGRLEGNSGRCNPSFEGAYLPNVNIKNSIKKYGSDILNEIESAIPNDFEEILISKNSTLFAEIYKACAESNDMSNLYNRFFIACGKNKKLIINKRINVNLPNINFIDSLKFKSKKKY